MKKRKRGRKGERESARRFGRALGEGGRKRLRRERGSARRLDWTLGEESKRLRRERRLGAHSREVIRPRELRSERKSQRVFFWRIIFRGGISRGDLAAA